MKTKIFQVLIVLLAISALFAWGFSSPIGATPDEDFHLASIWCGQGDRQGLCEPTGSENSRAVSSDIVHSAECFAYEAEISASCQGTSFGKGTSNLISTNRGNFENLYPPVFYWVMSWLATPNIYLSVALMRIFNILLFVGVIISIGILGGTKLSRSLNISLVFMAVPLGMFLLPSVNPTSWAMLTVPAAFITTKAIFISVGKRKLLLSVLLIILLVMGAGSRSDTGIFLILSITLATITSYTKSMNIWKLSIPSISAILVGLFFFNQSGQSSVITSGLGGDISYQGSLLGLVAKNILQAPLLVAGVFGEWGLGWLDTIMPAFIWVFGLIIFGIIVFAGFVGTKISTRLSLLFSIIATILIPVFVLVQSRLQVGEGVQPRYVLPLVILAAVISIESFSDGSIVLTRSGWIILAILAGLSNSIALFINTQRYATGIDIFNVDLNSYVEWSWPGSLSPMFLWLIGSVSFFTVAVLVAGFPKSQVSERAQSS